MPQPDPANVPGVVDLGNVAARLEAQESERVIREGKEAEVRVLAFLSAMNRAFKGIVPRPQREKLLRKAVADAEKREAAGE